MHLVISVQIRLLNFGYLNFEVLERCWSSSIDRLMLNLRLRSHVAPFLELTVTALIWLMTLWEREKGFWVHYITKANHFSWKNAISWQFSTSLFPVVVIRSFSLTGNKSEKALHLLPYLMPSRHLVGQKKLSDIEFFGAMQIVLHWRDNKKWFEFLRAYFK